MNKLCCVCYGADDKNFVRCTDYEFLRVIECNLKTAEPSFWLKRKVRRLSKNLCCFDSKGIAENTIMASPKTLFIRDIHRCIREYGRCYGIDFSKCELSVSGKISTESIKDLCSLFKMVWSTEGHDVDLYNLYHVKKVLPKTNVAIFSDKKVPNPEADIVFNLTDLPGVGVENIEVSSALPVCVPDIYAQEIIKACDFDYKIINFVK